ncbi:hypothetical protein [Sinorhizobium meliloti]|uniref:hypothetical protein n=1 Tax=Rhizobium meliloti TaxID=382 RepID=UPI001911C076|nr:hypothetical protein [Sinorhizobium meliloti]
MADRIRSCLLDKPEAVEAALIADLSALVRMLVRKCEKAGVDPEYMTKARDFLKRKGLEGSPLRARRADTGAAQSGGGSLNALIERLLKALEAAETYVIDGVTTAKQNLEMNAAYPARKPRYEAELQEARDIYDECQAARRAALAAAKDKP